VESRRTIFGRVVAEAGRLIGAPLPLTDELGAPATVIVTEDGARGGQFWTRVYGRARGFPQVIHSSKRFAGPTGLEEYLGCGFGIALALREGGQALHFQSDHYFIALGTFRVRLPRWIGPGRLTISHIDRGEDAFVFVLELRHALFGEAIRQTCLFHERPAPEAQEASDD
jgi:hypothetical protein